MRERFGVAFVHSRREPRARGSQSDNYATALPLAIHLSDFSDRSRSRLSFLLPRLAIVFAILLAPNFKLPFPPLRDHRDFYEISVLPIGKSTNERQDIRAAFRRK